MALPLLGRYKGGVTAILEKRIQRERKRSSRIWMKNMIQDPFPEDLVTEILSWLPVKTLLQFKVVCKSWYAIIEKPSFISKHLKNYFRNNDEHRCCLIAQYVVTQAGELDDYQLLVNDNTYRVLAYERILTPVHNTYICGPCDGIYYLWCWCDNKRFLWNPALKELKILPPINLKPNYLPSHISLDTIIDIYGFGYDPLMKDYKIVVIKGYRDTTTEWNHDTSYPLSIFIYSMNNGCWRYWGDLSKYYYLNNNKCYVFVNDSVYWLGSLDPYGLCDFGVIIAFNLATDNVEELQLPNYEKPTDDENLIVCYDSVALLVGYREKNYFMMWILNREGIWTNKSLIDLNFGLYYRPIGHWKDNKLIFQRSETFGLYDLESQETHYLKSPIRHYRCENITAYEESIVSVTDR